MNLNLQFDHYEDYFAAARIHWPGGMVTCIDPLDISIPALPLFHRHRRIYF